jgi:hypothetical protein
MERITSDRDPIWQQISRGLRLLSTDMCMSYASTTTRDRTALGPRANQEREPPCMKETRRSGRTNLGALFSPTRARRQSATLQTRPLVFGLAKLASEE